MANKVEIKWTQKKFNKHLSMDDKVQEALESVARQIYTAAYRDLAAHRKTGEHRIEIEKVKSAKYGHIDWVVSMTGENSVSVEFGHWIHGGTTYVRGLYIISNAKYAARF
jgi:ribosomal protein L20A (L18A)